MARIDGQDRDRDVDDGDDVRRRVVNKVFLKGGNTGNIRAGNTVHLRLLHIRSINADMLADGR